MTAANRAAVRLAAADAAMAGLGLLLLLGIASVPLDASQQVWFGAGALLLSLALNRRPGRFVSVLLVTISLAVTGRYVFWRLSETLQFDTWLEAILGTGLLLAEAYAAVMLLLDYLQNAWPRGRQPRALPDDPGNWPVVDVFIATFNEPLPSVRATVLAAMLMDWPQGKLHVHIVDRAKRDDVHNFAVEAGCSYLTERRTQPRGLDRNPLDMLPSRADTLNAARGQTTGPFIAVFDCGHIPTRAFLQFTLGWLAADSNLALVQTPRYCYLADPFQRSLADETRVPPQANLVEGLLQDASDAWGATLFCGSGAVLRRSALDAARGFALEPASADAITTFQLHRLGWDSAYLRWPLAAWTRAESLAQFIGRRQLQVRGMLQLLRLHNPLIARGLTMGQRLCYAQGITQALFALPRLTFLTAPLAYLLLGQTIIPAAPLAVAAYALPHLALAVAARSRLRGRWRHAFWTPVYELAQAPFMLRTAFEALIRPQRPATVLTAPPAAPVGSNKFAGDTKAQVRAALPQLFLATLLSAGILRGLVGIALSGGESLGSQAMLLNTAWACASLLTVLAVLAARGEAPEGMNAVPAALPVDIVLPDGRNLSGESQTLSLSGGNLLAARPIGLMEGASLRLTFTIGGTPISLTARVASWEANGALNIEWRTGSLDDEARLIRVVYGRADAWTGWAAQAADKPWLSLWRLASAAGGLFRRRKAVVGGVLLWALLATAPALAQQNAPSPKPARPAVSGMTVRVIPQAIAPQGLPTIIESAPLPPLPAPAPAPQPVAHPVVATPPVAAPTAAAPAAAEPVIRTSVRRAVYSLRQLGAAGPLALRGTNPMQSVAFGVRADEVVTSARLTLRGALSPSLIADASNITVTLNDQFAGTIPVTPDQPAYVLEMPISPVFFQDANQLSFRLTGRTADACNDPLSGLLWGTVYATSTLTMTLERLPPQRDLARLPQPFFDPASPELLSLPFVLPASPGNDALRAAGIAASWFGQLAGTRGANFPVLSEPPPEGNAVIVVAGDAKDAAGLSAIGGPTLAVIPNPNDRLSSLLVIAGRTGEEAVAAATALAAGSRTLSSALALVQAPPLAARQPYDAPAWIATDRPVKLGELAGAAALQFSGYSGQLHVPFRTAPDFYTWRGRPFDLTLRYRAPGAPAIDPGPSRLDAGLNGVYLDTLPLSGGGGLLSAHVAVPPGTLTGANDLQLMFDARPVRRSACDTPPQDLHMAVSADSTIDLSRGYRFTQLPNLAFFVSAGFPFTRMADLAETAIVLPERPSGIELSAFLGQMGRFGALTGTPSVSVAVTRPDGIAAFAGRDVLLLGAVQHLGTAAAALLTESAVRLDGAQVSAAASGLVERLLGNSGSGQAAAALGSGLTGGAVALAGGQSPLEHGRSVVALLAATPEGLDNAGTMLRDPALAGQVQGDLALFNGGKVYSYRVTTPFTVGTLPVWLWPSWYLRDQPIGLLLLMLAGSVLFAAGCYRALLRRRTSPPESGNPRT